MRISAVFTKQYNTEIRASWDANLDVRRINKSFNFSGANTFAKNTRCSLMHL